MEYQIVYILGVFVSFLFSLFFIDYKGLIGKGYNIFELFGFSMLLSSLSWLGCLFLMISVLTQPDYSKLKSL